MVRVGTPPDVENYIAVEDDNTAIELHLIGFEPLWRDDNYIYFKATEELFNILQRW